MATLLVTAQKTCPDGSAKHQMTLWERIVCSIGMCVSFNRNVHIKIGSGSRCLNGIQWWFPKFRTFILCLELAGKYDRSTNGREKLGFMLYLCLQLKIQVTGSGGVPLPPSPGPQRIDGHLSSKGNSYTAAKLTDKPMATCTNWEFHSKDSRWGRHYWGSTKQSLGFTS